MRLQGLLCVHLLALVLLIALSCARVSAAPILYSVTPDDELLRQVDQGTGETFASVPVTLAGETVRGGLGLAVDPITNQLFGLLNLFGQSERELVIIDPTTGVATSIGNTGDSFSGIAFDSTGTLFGVTGDGASTAETLFTLSTTDAASTFFQTLGNGDDGETIAFNPDNGLMYHASGNFDKAFETVNLSTNAVGGIPLSGFAYTEALGLTYAGADTFFMTDLDGNFLTITTDGVVTRLGGLDYRGKGLALLDEMTPIPEPSTFLLLASGLAGLVYFRRKNTRQSR